MSETKPAFGSVFLCNYLKQNSMSKSVTVNFKFDPKTVRKAVVLITGEMLTDEQIEEKFFSKPIDVDTQEVEDEGKEIQMCAAIIALVLSKE